MIPTSAPRYRRCRRGSALVSAILVLAVLVGLVASLAPVVRVEVRSAGRDGDELRALYLARAGAHLALAALTRDDPTVDGPEDEWALLGERGQVEYPLGEGFFRLEVIDASSRLDLNRADRETLQRLPGIDEAIVDEILAWRGDNDAEGRSAATYESGPAPYRLKAGPFDSVEELLLVQGVTPLLLYGPRDVLQTEQEAPWIDLLFVDTSSPNRDASGAPRLDLNAATARELVAASGGALREELARIIVQQRARNGPFTSLARLLELPGMDANSMRQIVDRVTLEPGDTLHGRLNLNTASVEALETLPDVTPEMADAIQSHRETQGDFESMGDLMDLGEETFRALADHVTTRSDTFIVRVWGEVESGAGRAVEAWVRREGGRARVIRWRDVPRSPGWDTWRWEESALGAGRLALGPDVGNSHGHARSLAPLGRSHWLATALAKRQAPGAQRRLTGAKRHAT